MKLFRILLAVVAVAVLGSTFLGTARADLRNKKTILTFSHPVEVPGNVVLPAGKYVFKLHDSANRNIVQIWSADETKLITTILAISDQKLRPSEKTIIEFREQTGNVPHAIRAWFYPGETVGRAFVYPKARAEELAKTNDVIVPAETVEAPQNQLTTVLLVAITPQEKEEPIEQAFAVAPAQTAPAEVEVAQELPTRRARLHLSRCSGWGLSPSEPA